MSPSKKYTVVWAREANEDLISICDYIKKDSPAAAIRVKKVLIQLAKTLKSFPDRNPIEYYFQINGDYRFLVRWDYKLIYEVTVDKVIIQAIVHTARNPDIPIGGL